jgi:N-acetylglucosamine kinase-like BadF-type ATPase
MEKKYFFGIDGGGTHSRLALLDRDGKILARSEAGSTNIYSVSKEEVFENLFTLLSSALDAAGVDKKNIAAGCLGSAGLGGQETEIVRGFFDTFLGAEIPVKLCSDGEILLCGGLDKMEGYCLIAGTGSIALGRFSSGEVVRSGGYGYLLGDEGSASWIGRTAIARVLRSLDNRDIPTEMLIPLLEAAGAGSTRGLIHYVHHEAGKAKIAALAPLVTAAARNGDALALDILFNGAEELSLLVKSVIFKSREIKNRELVLAGGVVKNDEVLTGKLREILAAEIPDLLISTPKKTALDGACMMAINFGGG